MLKFRVEFDIEFELELTEFVIVELPELELVTKGFLIEEMLVIKGFLIEFLKKEE